MDKLRTNHRGLPVLASSLKLKQIEYDLCGVNLLLRSKFTNGRYQRNDTTSSTVYSMAPSTYIRQFEASITRLLALTQKKKKWEKNIEKYFLKQKKTDPTKLHSHISDWPDSTEKNCIKSTNYFELLSVMKTKPWLNAIQWESSRRSHGSASKNEGILR